jgi:hypothetical protein
MINPYKKTLVLKKPPNQTLSDFAIKTEDFTIRCVTISYLSLIINDARARPKIGVQRSR